jgi:hypothetical protein
MFFKRNENQNPQGEEENNSTEVVTVAEVTGKAENETVDTIEEKPEERTTGKVEEKPEGQTTGNIDEKMKEKKKVSWRIIVPSIIALLLVVALLITSIIFYQDKVSLQKTLKDTQTELKSTSKELNARIEAEKDKTFDYLAIGKGYKETKDKKLIKQKGLFIDKVSLGKGMQPLIIPKALNAYFADKIPIEETITSSRDINDFLTYQKPDKKFNVEYNDEIVTRINRYYASTDGCFLYKCIVDKDGNRSNYTNMLKSSGVTLANDLTKIKEFPTNINYRYYIKECKKILDPFIHRQLTLF